MMPSRKLLPALVPLFLLVACASYDYHKGVMGGPRGAKTPSPEISSGHGRVWFYRNAPRSTPGLWPTVLLDGKVAADANPYKLYYVDISPGTHEVSIGSNKLTITVEKQRHLFIETKVSKEGIYPSVVDPEIGKQAIGLISCESAAGEEGITQCK